MPSATTTTQSHARSHALLLLQKLLNLRDSASPLTLVLDTLEQSGKPVLREFMRRAQISKAKIIYVSFATPRKPETDSDTDLTFIRARGKTADSLRSEIVSHYPSSHTQKALLIIDELNPLAGSIPTTLAIFLSSLITTPSLSLICLYHTDIPLSHPSTLLPSPYSPHPLTILTHLSTAVLRVSSLSHAIARRRARDRSQPEPDFGLDEAREGVLIGLDRKLPNTSTGARAGAVGSCSLVLEMELRRRSGRAAIETFVLATIERGFTIAQTPGRLHLLSDHPAFRDPDVALASVEGGEGKGEQQPESTFDLGLTEKQRRDREGVVLPYFDAQAEFGGGGAAEGGRILYDMGREDDFDEEEDEI